jgi:DNA topoisomerase VI subunit B
MSVILQTGVTADHGPGIDPPACSLLPEAERPATCVAMVAAVPPPKTMTAVSALLSRHAFRTSRLLDFCNRRELIAQTGHQVEDWPLVIVKELIDNPLDDAEEIGVPPVVEVNVSPDRGEIVIADNGSGLPPETVVALLDYSIRVSSREAYVSPTRGAQGNAIKTVIAMAFALDGTKGETIIEARRVAHRITFGVDPLRQEPRISHQTASSDVTVGTRITVRWPDSASSMLRGARGRFLQIAEDFAWLNPHLRIIARWDNELRVDRQPSNPGWEKWRACDPTSAHWYSEDRFERYIAAHVARDQETVRDRMVREFIRELRGLSGSATQKAVLADTGMSRAALASLFEQDGSPRRDAIARLLAACQKHTRPVKPKALGVIGRDHLLMCFRAAGVHEASFKYEMAAGETDGLPWIVETAFGFCPKHSAGRRIIAGVNFSVGIDNPFRSFRRYGGEGLEAHLNQLRAAANEPIVVVLHYVCPRVEFTDRGKTAVIVPGAGPASARNGD